MIEANAKTSNSPMESKTAATQFFIPEFFKAMDTRGWLYSNYVRTLLCVVARQLQDQADYLRKLSSVTRPAKALDCHAEFVHNLMTSWTSEGQRLVDESLHQVKADPSKTPPTAH